MARGSGKLCGMIKPDDDYVWNGSGTIENSAGSFEFQIGDRRIALFHNDWELGTVTLSWDLNESLAQLDYFETRIRDWQSTAKSIDIGLAMGSQVFSLVINIGQSLSRAMTRSTRWKLSAPTPLDSAPPMARPTIQLPAKRKQGRSTGRANKCAK